MSRIKIKICDPDVSVRNVKMEEAMVSEWNKGSLGIIASSSHLGDFVLFR